MAVKSTQKRALTPKETRAQQNWRLANLRRAGLPVPPRGQRTKYKEEYVDQAEKLCALGATDAETARFFNVSVPTLSSWAAIHEDFGAALQKGGAVADERVERSLYQRANGYSYESEKIIYDAKRGEVIRVPIVVHVPPDVTAQIFWLKNRDPKNWRDRREVGMDRPMTVPAITSDMTPRQAMEAFVATLRGAVVVEAVEQDEECSRSAGPRPPSPMAMAKNVMRDLAPDAPAEPMHDRPDEAGALLGRKDRDRADGQAGEDK
jgi:hypothetical protein